MIVDRIGLKLKNKHFELVKIEEKYDASQSKNNFIKVTLKRIFPDPVLGSKKFSDEEYTLHPTKTQHGSKCHRDVDPNIIIRKITDNEYERITPEKGKAFYETIHPNTGYENFDRSVLQLYQSTYSCGFSFLPYQDHIPNIQKWLQLDVEQDHPFWIGFYFSKLPPPKIAAYFENKGVLIFHQVSCEEGTIIVAIKKLTAIWEQMKMPKELFNYRQGYSAESFTFYCD